ncbi:MAG: FHA domain-containing protein [Planctomycetes bacterium]|nr:FHA domain-containing protein [Planctomycetota bacterium]
MSQDLTAVSPPERVLKTLLITDLVNSTALVDALGDYRSVEIFERHDQIARKLLIQFHGLEIDKTDGFLFLFDRPFDAVLYVMALHDALAELSDELDVRLAVRAGIHLGEIVLRKNKAEFVALGAKPIEVEGLAKPTTARIMSLAQGSQTLMTRTAFDLARRAAVGHDQTPDDIRWVTHGEYQFKGIEETHMIYEVGHQGRAPFAPPPSTEKAGRVSRRSAGEDVAWCPIAGVKVPGNPGWKLERKVATGEPGEIWLARERNPVSNADRTIALDVELITPRKRRRRAFLFWRTFDERDSTDGTPFWELADPIACIAVRSGSQEGSFVMLTQKPLTCGRDSTMDLRIDDPKVSRRHLEVYPKGDGYAIREAQTRNGVFVNGSRIDKEQVLHNGDEISIGETVLAFYHEPEGDRSPAGSLE